MAIDTPMSDHACMNASVSNIALGKIQLQFVLKQDPEQQITESSLPFGIANWGKLTMEQELWLWLSCFIVCTPRIVAHCKTAADKLLTLHLSELISALCNNDCNYKFRSCIIHYYLIMQVH